MLLHRGNTFLLLAHKKCASMSAQDVLVAWHPVTYSASDFDFQPSDAVNFYLLKGPTCYSSRATKKEGISGDRRTLRPKIPPSKCTFHFATKNLSGEKHRPPDDRAPLRPPV